MESGRLITVVSFLFASILAGGAYGDDLSIGLSVGNDGEKSFHLAIATHYKTTEKAIGLVKKKGISDEELPVVFFLADRGGIKPEVLINLRLRGRSWADITHQLGLGAEIYYVALRGSVAPPYGKAYGHFKNRPRKEWNKIILSDTDIMNLVNLKFMSKHYGYPPEEVMKLRSKGNGFVAVNKILKIKKMKGTKTRNKAEKKITENVPINKKKEKIHHPKKKK